MAKKRSCRRTCDDNEDSNSYASSITAYSNTFGEQEVLHSEAEAFAACIDETYESRGSTREAAWERLGGMLRSSVRADDCCQNASTVVGRAQFSMRKGSAAEAAAAATTLGLHLMTIGEQDESLYADVQPDLLKVAKSAKTPAARVAGVEALAVVCFCCSEDPMSTLDAMQQLQELWKPGVSGKVRAAAMRAWSFLYTSLRHAPSSDAVQPLLQGLASCLHDTDVDVRNAAGEALTLVYHTNKAAAGSSSDEEGWEDDQEEEEAPDDMSVEGSGQLPGLEDVVDRMKQLATNRGEALRRSKKDKAALRSVFRELHSTLQGNAAPITKVKLRHGSVLVVDTVTGNITLNYLRKFLATGFQVHLQSNPLLHAVFGFQPAEEAPERLSAAEKRAFKSPGSVSSKARAQDRKSRRASKAAACW